MAALQNPRTRLNDSELKTARVEVDGLGLPRAMTGASAIVFRLGTSSGAFALRCFLRGDSHEAEHRYEAIERYLSSRRIGYLVPPTFLATGIRMGSDWLPVVKMSWVDGDPISTYVGQHVEEAHLLRRLVTSWVDMADALERAQIVHGDLQHGNVLVVNGQPTLVDYDGLRVPTLQVQNTAEIGHPNYQHPRRFDRMAGSAVDRFSEWVVYVSLAALIDEPYLWKRLNGGDECLLLRAKDFGSPATSQAFSLLKKHRSSHVREVAERLMRNCREDPCTLPPLREIFPASVRTTCPAKRAQSGVSAAAPAIPWYATHTSRDRGPAEASQSQAGRSGYGARAWVPELLAQKETRPVAIRPTTRACRMAWIAGGSLELSVLLTVLIAGWHVIISVALAAPITLFFSFVGAFGYLYHMYRQESAVASRAAVLRRYRACKRQADDSAARVRQITGLLEATDEFHRKTEASIKNRRKKSIAEYRARVAAEEQALKHARTQLATDITDLAAQRNQARAALLRDLQTSWVESRLRDLSILATPIPGVSKDLRRHLAAHGIRTAADIDRSRILNIPAVGRDTAGKLVRWRRQMEQTASATVPTTLPPPKERRLNKRFDGAIKKAEKAAAALEYRHKEELTTLDANQCKALTMLDREHEELKEQHRSQRAGILPQLVQTRKAAGAAIAPLEAAERDLSRYAGATLRSYVWHAWLWST